MSTTSPKDVSELAEIIGPCAARERLENNQRPLVIAAEGSHTPARRGRDPEPEKEWPGIESALRLIETFIPIPEEIIDGILHKGSIMMLGGGSKTNKTFCLLDMAISVAGGVPWWELKTTQGKVLYIDFELQRPFLRRRIQSIVEEKQIHYDALKSLDILPLRGFVSSHEKLIPKIIDAIKAKNYIMIVIDPYYKAMGGSEENAAGDINEMMNSLQLLASDSGAAIVYAHHFSKGNQAAKESIDRVSGSGVFGRAPDSILTLTRHEADDDIYSVMADLRNSKRMEPFVVEWHYPLMVRNNTLNPKKLKQPGKKTEQYTVDMLLDCFGDGTPTTKEWEVRTCNETGMAPRTFYDKLKKLKTLQPCPVNELDNGKWEKTQTAG